MKVMEFWVVDLDIYEAALAYTPDVQLSTGKLTNYDIIEPGVLDRHQRRWKKSEMRPVSDGESKELSIEEMSYVTVLGLWTHVQFGNVQMCPYLQIIHIL